MNTQFFLISWLDNKVWGAPIEPRQTSYYRKQYDNCFDFPGETASFFLVCSDHTIRRKDALKFAATIAAGKFVWCRLDLSQLGRFPKGKK